MFDTGGLDRVESVAQVIIDDARHLVPHIWKIRDRVEPIVLQVSSHSTFERDELVGLVELGGQAGLAMVVAPGVVDGTHLIQCFIVRETLVNKASPIHLRLSA